MSKNMQGTLIEASDTSFMANIKDGKKRKPHQLITILLDEVSQEEFSRIAFAKKIELKVIDSK